MAGLVPDVRVYGDLEALSHAAAALVVESAALACSERGRFRIAFSGGATPKWLYLLLAASPYREGIEWPNLQAFWGDERCVPKEDLDSNYRQTQDILLSQVPVRLENVFRVRTELGPDLAAQDYSTLLRMKADAPLAWPRLDLVLLGLGADGHIASLFPGSAADADEPAVLVRAPAGYNPALRVSLTPGVFNAARRVLFLVHGAEKARIVAKVLYGEVDPNRFPAQGIRPSDGELIWMLDAGAAAGPVN
jgi:6-phosphogluconolactonase